MPTPNKTKETNAQSLYTQIAVQAFYSTDPKNRQTMWLVIITNPVFAIESNLLTLLLMSP